MKYFLFFIFLFALSIQCKAPNNEFKRQVSVEDSIFVENELKQYKNCLFSNMYYFGLKNTYSRLGIDEKEILKVKDLTYSYYSGEFNPSFMINDINRDKMFEKWLNDLKYEPNTEINDGSLDIVRALDFYNSKDLEIYIDSLKRQEYKRIINEEKN